ncbi:cobalt-precorrin-4 C11-methyltransferase [Cutibacterium acnes JCM 18916]|nr:cobalt-precorrin-4 C11-methyltransferase [Cutibacterium acnes JCM 18916]
MSEPQAARPTQHVSEKALEDLDHNVIEPPPVPRRDIPEGAGKVVFVGAGPGAPDLVSVRGARVIETADIIIWPPAWYIPTWLPVTRRALSSSTPPLSPWRTLNLSTPAPATRA